MSNNEKFSLSKFFDFGGIAWATTAGLAVKVIIIVLIVLGGVMAKNFFFPEPPANVNAPEITVSEGGVATYTVNQYSEKERKWWVPTPFVEVFGEKTDKDEGINVGARFGARWEF